MCWIIELLEYRTAGKINRSWTARQAKKLSALPAPYKGPWNTPSGGIRIPIPLGYKKDMRRTGETAKDCFPTCCTRLVCLSSFRSTFGKGKERKRDRAYHHIELQRPNCSRLRDQTPRILGLDHKHRVRLGRGYTPCLFVSACRSGYKRAFTCVSSCRDESYIPANP